MLRWAFRILGILVALTLAALLVRIVPAHLQIRRVHSWLPTAAELRTLLAAHAERSHRGPRITRADASKDDRGRRQSPTASTS